MFGYWFSRSTLLVSALVFVLVSGCGGSRNSREDNPTDFSLGAGDVQATWIASSDELIHDRERGALYYADVESQRVMRVEVDGGTDEILQDLLFEPHMLRMTTDAQYLYILESEDSTDENDGFADIVRYDIDGGFIDTDVIELDSNVSVDDFVATTTDRVVVASHDRLVPPAATPTTLNLDLYNVFNGISIDQLSSAGARLLLALNADQQTVLAELMYGSGYALTDVSIAGDVFTEGDSRQLLLSQGAQNTFEPGTSRIFRSNGEVLSDEGNTELDSGYLSIDFVQNDERIVTLVDGASGYLIHYYDSESLDLLSEQALPTIEDTQGMAPRTVFVDDGHLYVVYRETTSSVTANWLLVQFDYP